MRVRCLTLLAVIGSFGLGESLAAQPHAGVAAEPRWREANLWRQPNGLPQDSVITLLQTRDGYLWVGTRGGVSRFDGVRFTTFDDRDKTQLRENEVWGLAEDGDGSLWIGVYGGGLSRLQRGVFTAYGVKDGLVDDFVRLLVMDAAGALWIGTDQGVSRFKDGTFTSYTVKEGLLSGAVRALIAEPNGGVLVAMQGGLQRIAEGRVEPVRLPGYESRLPGLVDTLLHTRDGALWIGTSDGLLRVAGGSTARYTTADGLSSNAVRRLHEDNSGRLWIATTAGLDRHAGSAAGAAGASAAFVKEAASDDLTALHSDREGGLWVGHRGAGLARFHQGIFAAYTAADGLPNSEMTTVLHDRSGVTWIGTAGGLAVLHGRRFTPLLEAHGLPSVPVQALAEDRDGHLWVGTQKGAFRSDRAAACAGRRCDPRFHALREDPVLANQIRVILQDRSGSMWIGTDRSGLVRYEQGRVTTFNTASGLSNDSIRALAETKDGSLWIGTKGGGLDRLQDGTFTSFQQEQGLPNNSVQALYADADDALWIATRQGVSRYKDGRFATYTVKDGLLSSHVYSFLEDELGNLWMSSGKGVFRARKSELNDFAEGRIEAIRCVPYNREHGLPSSMAAVASYPGVAKSADGRVWFAIVGGLAVADPKRLPTNPVPPPVHMEEVRIDNRAFDRNATAEAPPGRGDLTFRYAALSFEAPQAVKIRYRLEGFDNDWVDADTRRVANYTNMPPGDYRFRVIAANSDGVWNEQGAAFALSLAPHFYQTRWFYAAIALALILAGAATQRLRVRRLQKRARELTVKVDEAQAEVKVLTGLLPICASCKMIRDDAGEWSQLETYIHAHSDASFSHGICPDCAEKWYPGVSERIKAKATA